MSEAGGDRPQRIERRLAEVLGERLDGGVRRLSSGASRETFLLFTASGRELVAQLERHGRQLGGSPEQAPLLEAAARCGVPVPRVVAHGGEDPVLGRRWTVVQALPGTSDPKRILSGAEAPDGAELLDQLAAALAAVHRMPADAGLVEEVEDPIALLRGMHDSLGEPHPTFELAFRALQGTRPDTVGRTVVHGDFRMGNLLVGPEGLTGVLDWELAHVGDPAEDLGWLCVPAWRFARPDRAAAGLGSREQLLAAYERHAGVAVDPRTLRWWELAGTLRWGVICVMQAFVHLSGATHSIEHAVIGRRACEVEWDLLELLDPEGARTAADEGGEEGAQAGGPMPARLHDRPTAVELLQAARATLGEELPRLEGRSAFQLRVTMRALGIVAREVEGAARHTRIHAAALGSLGVGDERELASAIRSGELRDRERDVLGALRAIVRAKLEAANPGYLSWSEKPRPTEGQ